jgi:nucleoside-diphosphate-sugar epimerase
MSKVFVAGASGVIGRRLVPLLVEAGHEVTGTTVSGKQSEFLQSLGARPAVMDAFDRDQVFAVLGDARPDVVIDQMTSLSHGDYPGTARLRKEGTRHLVDAALAVGVTRFIAQSYAQVYAPGPELATEDDTFDLDAPPSWRVNVEGVYALEQAVADMPEGVMLRYGTLYGPGTGYAPDGAIAERVRRGELPATDGVSPFLHIDDAARAAVLALDWPAGPINIVDDDPTPGTEWLPIFASYLGAPPPPVKHTRERWERGISNAKARHQLGWQPLYPTWREGFWAVLQREVAQHSR